MKKIMYKFSALLSVSALSVVGCIEENFENTIPAAVGDEIVFGARAGFENSNPETRTVYSDNEYTVGDVKFERIDWVENDKIEIYCPHAANTTSSHYNITGMKAGDEGAGETQKGSDYAYLTRIGDSALQWGEGYGIDVNNDGKISDDEKGYHNFYAMYPSSLMFTTDPSKTVETGIYMNNKTVKGIVPITQNPIGYSGTDTDVIALPNMDFAYMVSKDTANRANGAVSLSFVPIVTAAEIQLKLTSAIPEGATAVTPVQIAEIQVEGSGIAGSFTADLDSWTSTYPTCTNATDATDVIQISTWRKSGDKYVPVTVSPGGTFTFTVFLLPGADINNLKIRISADGASYIGKTLNGITVRKNLKNIYKNLMLPATGVEVDASRWMSQLDQATNLNRLSLPGTANSFSNLSTAGDYYKAQLASFADQWKAGIRAFEITCSRPSAATTSLGTMNVMCNNESVGKTVRNVFDMILDNTDDDDDSNGIIGPNSTECAMVILTYQPGGTGDYGRDPSIFMGALNVLYDELIKAYPPVTVNGISKSRFSLYSPTLTLEQAKGTIMIVARPTQLDEDSGEVRKNALEATGSRPILVVDGCGTGKDKWGRRGYRVNGALAADIKDAATGAPVFENYFTTSTTGWSAENPENQTYPSWDGVVSKDSKGNYSYNTNNSFSIWFQEWARVVEAPAKVNAGSATVVFFTNFYYASWWESYTEKLSTVKDTFDMALSDEYSDEYVFINSLSGYLMDVDNEESRMPYMNRDGLDFAVGGKCGRIGDLAKKLNNDFYNYVLSAGMSSKTGPTGIVLMDRVTTTLTSGNEGSYYLPGVIIANNFKHGDGSSIIPEDDNEKNGNEATKEEIEG